MAEGKSTHTSTKLKIKETAHSSPIEAQVKKVLDPTHPPSEKYKKNESQVTNNSRLNKENLGQHLQSFDHNQENTNKQQFTLSQEEVNRTQIDYKDEDYLQYQQYGRQPIPIIGTHNETYVINTGYYTRHDINDTTELSEYNTIYP